MKRLTSLSSKELMTAKYRKAEELNVPGSSGGKHTDADGSFLQAKQLEHFHRDYIKLINCEKVQRLGALCLAEYEKEKARVIVTKVKGNLLSHFGHTESSHTVLYPEEALFLMDSSCLQLSSDGVPLSMQEAYNLLLLSEQSACEYFVFSHLCRLGYIVLRHNAQRSELVKHKRKAEAYSIHSNKMTKLEHGSFGMSKESVVRPCSDQYCSVAGAQKHCKSERSLLEVSALGLQEKNHMRSGSSSVYTKWDFSDIEFPPEGGMKPRVLPAEGSNMLAGIPTSSFADVGLLNQSQSTTEQNEKYFEFFSLMDYRTTKCNSSAENWSSFKREHLLRLNELTRMAGHSLAGNIGDPVSMQSVLERLQLTTTGTLDGLRHEMKAAHRIAFDVYQPSSSFRKTSPGAPHHRVCVVRSSDDVPSLADLVELQCLDGTPLYWAVFDHGDITFYNFSCTQIPVDWYDKVSPE